MAWCINTGKSLKYTPQKFPFSGLLHQYSVFLHSNIRHARALHTILPCLSSHFEAAVSAKPWPNHHYAMHNAKQLKFWGPLPQVSKFFGEHQNGQLQSIKTNGIFCTFQHYRPITALTTINRPDGPHHAPNNCAPTVISCLCPEHQQHQTWFNSSNIGSACNSNAGNWHTTHCWRDWEALYNTWQLDTTRNL